MGAFHSTFCNEFWVGSFTCVMVYGVISPFVRKPLQAKQANHDTVLKVVSNVQITILVVSSQSLNDILKCQRIVQNQFCLNHRSSFPVAECRSPRRLYADALHGTCPTSTRHRQSPPPRGHTFEQLPSLSSAARTNRTLTGSFTVQFRC